MLLDYQVLFVRDRFTRPLYTQKITEHFEFVPRLRENDRVQAIVLLASSVSVSDVARQFHRHRSTINNLRQRFRQTGCVKDAVRSGRPKVTTPRQDRYITLTHLRNRFKTAKSTGIQFVISRQTVLNRLRINADPIRARRPYVGHIIRPRNRNLLLLLWARRHLRLTRAQSEGLVYRWVAFQSELCWWQNTRFSPQRWMFRR